MKDIRNHFHQTWFIGCKFCIESTKTNAPNLWIIVKEWEFYDDFIILIRKIILRFPLRNIQKVCGNIIFLTLFFANIQKMLSRIATLIKNYLILKIFPKILFLKNFPIETFNGHLPEHRYFRESAVS